MRPSRIPGGTVPKEDRRGLLGPEREKLITLPRKQGKSRLIGTFSAWHLLTIPGAQAYIAANSEEQARIVFEYARAVAQHPAVEEEFEVRYRELRRPDGGFLRVRAADPAKLLGLTPSLAVLDEYCAAKDDKVYTALRSALLPGATMYTITRRGWVPTPPWVAYVLALSASLTFDIGDASPTRGGRTFGCSNTAPPTTSRSTITGLPSRRTRSR